MKLFISLLALYVISGCTPLRDNIYDSSPLNYMDQGFITPDILQIYCPQTIHSEYQRNNHLKICKENVALFIANYLLSLHLVTDIHLNKQLIKKPLKPRATLLTPSRVEKMDGNHLTRSLQYTEYEWTPEQKEIIINYYKESTKGTIIKENIETDRIIFLYRVEQKNLLYDLYKKPFPFKYEITNK